MSERLKYQGRLAEKEQEERRLKLRLEGLVESLRDQLDPTIDVARLKGKLIAEEALQLAGILGELRAVQEDMEKIRELLGR